LTFLPSGAASAVAGAEQTGVGTGVVTGLHEAGGGVVMQSGASEQPQNKAAIVSRTSISAENRAV